MSTERVTECQHNDVYQDGRDNDGSQIWVCRVCGDRWNDGMGRVNLENMPEHLIFTGTDQQLRRHRIVKGTHRTWSILPRYGTTESDRWTVIGQPIPWGGNPAAAIEDGQFPDLASAKEALQECERLDDGTHQED